MKHIPKDSLILLNRRRLLGRLVLGGTTALALAACGGGGDGGDDKGSATKSLREVYDKLEAGMSYEDVRALVGFDPYRIDGIAHDWQLDDEYLFTRIIKDTTDTYARIRNAHYVSRSPRLEIRKTLP